jgi:hypothetical protein
MMRTWPARGIRHGNVEEGRRVLTLLALLMAAGDGFEGCGEVSGVSVASRPVVGSAFSELRFTLDVPGDAQAMCARAFGTGQIEPGEPHVRLRQVLRELADVRITYEQLSPPVVDPRDYVLERTRTVLPKGSCRVDFKNADAPLKEGYVRLRRLAGSYVFEPLPNGLVHVEHRIHLDLGGSLSPMLVEPSRRTMGAQWLKRLLGV